MGMEVELMPRKSIDPEVHKLDGLFRDFKEKLERQYQKDLSEDELAEDYRVLIVTADFWNGSGRDDLIDTGGVRLLGGAKAYRDGHHKEYLAIAAPHDCFRGLGGPRPNSGIRPGAGELGPSHTYVITRAQYKAIARYAEQDGLLHTAAAREIMQLGAEDLRDGRSPFIRLVGNVPSERSNVKGVRGNYLADPKSRSVEGVRLERSIEEWIDSLRLTQGDRIETDYKFCQRLLQSGLIRLKADNPEMFEGLDDNFLFF